MRTYGRLLPPSTPQGLPQGDERGGVFTDAFVPETYQDIATHSIPTNSPMVYVSSEDIFQRPIHFAPTMQTRQLTRGFGEFAMRRADPPGMPPQGFPDVPLPHGADKGGIFGSGRIVDGTSGHTLGEKQTYYDTIALRPRQLTRAQAMNGGPDGIGGFGCGPCRGR